MASSKGMFILFSFLKTKVRYSMVTNEFHICRYDNSLYFHKAVPHAEFPAVIVCCLPLCPPNHYVFPTIVASSSGVFPTIVSSRLFCPFDRYVLPTIMSSRRLCSSDYCVFATIMSSQPMCPLNHCGLLIIISPKLIYYPDLSVLPTIMLFRSLCPPCRYVRPSGHYAPDHYVLPTRNIVQAILSSSPLCPPGHYVPQPLCPPDHYVLQ